MRRYEERTRTYRHLVGTDCDLCGKDVEAAGHGVFDRRDVTIRATRGDVYPEGGEMTEQLVDVCLECWDAKVVPALEALGLTIREETHDV